MEYRGDKMGQPPTNTDASKPPITDEIKKLEEFKCRITDRQIHPVYSEAPSQAPSQGALERVIRYEAHLSREFDRTLNQLERLQRMRLGYPVAPPINVQIAGRSNKLIGTR
jgi:hypothetical protein